MHISKDTPTELRDRDEVSEIKRELFDLYIDTRYDERTEPSGEKIEYIKKNIENN